MAKTIKALIPVRVYERETMTASGDRFSKEIQLVAIPKKIYVDEKHAQKVVRDIMSQMYGAKKYKQKFDLGVKVW